MPLCAERAAPDRRPLGGRVQGKPRPEGPYSVTSLCSTDSKGSCFLPQVGREDEEVSEEETEEEDDIDNILEEEFPKDEEVMSDEEEEQENDALERLKGELGEKYETDMSNAQAMQVITFPSFFMIRK